MEFKDIQNKSNEIVERIDKKLNVNHNAENVVIHLTEELGEIARQINNKNLRNKDKDLENLKEEVSDLIILALRLGAIHNIDMEKSILNKIEKLKQRHSL